MNHGHRSAHGERFFKGAKSLQGLDQTETTRPKRHMSASPGNRLFDRLHRVRGTRHPARMSSVEHRQIIIMIPGRKNLIGLKTEQPGQFPKGGSFAVSFVTKAHVDGVAHELKAGHPPAFLFQKDANAIHFFIGLRGQPNQTPTLVNGMRLHMHGEKLVDISQQQPRGFKERVVSLNASSIPISIILPAAGGSTMKHLPFCRQHEVVLNRKLEIAKPLDDMTQLSARVHRPIHSLRFQLYERLQKCGSHPRLHEMIDHCPVKIGAKQFYHSGKLGVERWNFRVKVNRTAASSSSLRFLHSTNNFMKSAYELAMERLEKQSPTAKITKAQKAELAEIDTIFKAKIAEREVFLKDQLDKARATDKHGEALELEDELARDLRRLNAECEAKKEKVRQRGA